VANRHAARLGDAEDLDRSSWRGPRGEAAAVGGNGPEISVLPRNSPPTPRFIPSRVACPPSPQPVATRWLHGPGLSPETRAFSSGLPLSVRSVILEGGCWPRYGHIVACAIIGNGSQAPPQASVTES
jgi:hypothetical protein